MSLRYRIGTRVDSDDDQGPLRFVIATEGRKADGLDLRMDRLDLDRYRSNPVIQPQHDWRAWPIGRGENVEVRDGSLLADAVFDLDDPVGAEVDRKYRGRFLNAVSVGFDVHNLDEQTGMPERWELLEFSAVTIPLDADALVESGRMARALALTEELRAGKVLSSKNQTLVEEAIGALQSLLEAAKKADADEEQDDDPDDGRTAAGIDIRRRRLQLLGV